MKKRTPIVALVAACSLAALLAISACAPQEQQAATGTADDQQEQTVQDQTAEETEKDDAAEQDTAPEEPSAQRDPADPPNATVSLADDPDVSASPLPCSSTMTFEQDGEPMTVTTDAPHPVQYEASGMPALSASGSTRAVARFDEPATRAEVVRYLESDISEAADAAGSVHGISASDVIGEVIDSQVTDGAVSFNVEGGYRYALEVSFDSGIAMYVFTVTAA